MMEIYINARIDGGLVVKELGGPRARAIAFVIVPSILESLDAALAAVSRVMLDTREPFSSGVFENARSHAVYQLFARLENESERDELVSEYVRTGRDPRQGMRAEIQAVLQLSSEDAWRIAREQLGMSRAAIVQLTPETVSTPLDVASEAAPGVTAALEDLGELVPQSHDPHEPQSTKDSSAAHAEEKQPLSRESFARVLDRTLPNGMRVILMPLSIVPTVDVRLVLRAGLLDEPYDQRGISIFAAHALAPPSDQGMREFYAAGGHYHVQVGMDRTTFSTHGLDMDVDQLLSGMARLVRDGVYNDLGHGQFSSWPGARAHPHERLAELWRIALYGAEHPYTRVHDRRRPWFAPANADVLDVFRARYFRPGAATLIVAGGFDPKVADRWVNHLFKGWGDRPALVVEDGRVKPLTFTSPPANLRGVEPRRLQPLALAEHRDGPQVTVDIAIQVDGGRAASMVTAQMIHAAIADVRHQLGASYDLAATFDDSRYSKLIRITGLVGVERTHEAISLLRDRIGQLATGTEATPRFVAARRTVMMRMSSMHTGASALADLAESAVDRDQPIDWRVALAEETRKLTLAQVSRTLASVDLHHAAILLRGPREVVTRAFTALDRTPRFVE